MYGVSDAKALVAKRAYSSFALLHNVEVNQYHTENLPFNLETFLEDVTHKNQKIMFYGIGAHHQNGIAKNGIKRLFIIRQTVLLDAKNLNHVVAVCIITHSFQTSSLSHGRRWTSFPAMVFR